MKPLLKFASLLIGFLMIWLLIHYTRHSAKTSDSAFSPAPAQHLDPEQNDWRPEHFVAAPFSEPFESSVPMEVEEVLTAGEKWKVELAALKELAATDPDAALERVAQMPEKEDRVVALKEVSLRIAEQDPAKALTRAWDLGLGQFADELSDEVVLETLAGQWAVVDLSGALAWAGRQPADDEQRRDLVIKGLALVLSRTSPEEAAHLVATQMIPDRVQVDAAVAVVGEWARQDPAGASAWVALFPEGPVRTRAAAELAKALTNNPPATESMLN